MMFVNKMNIFDIKFVKLSKIKDPPPLEAEGGGGIKFPEIL